MGVCKGPSQADKCTVQMSQSTGAARGLGASSSQPIGALAPVSGLAQQAITTKLACHLPSGRPNVSPPTKPRCNSTSYRCFATDHGLPCKARKPHTTQRFATQIERLEALTGPPLNDRSPDVTPLTTAPQSRLAHTDRSIGVLFPQPPPNKADLSCLASTSPNTTGRRRQVLVHTNPPKLARRPPRPSAVSSAPILLMA